uniref:Uncharacterized protein LOC114345283 n=1 Tax=Diabrotica virgifera virgifera TaxID=50390 RepID=A0A6P7GQP9_DIAVI
MVFKKREYILTMRISSRKKNFILIHGSDRKSIAKNDNADILEAGPSDGFLEVGPSEASVQHLLLDTVKQQTSSSPKKKRRIAAGAEVITLQEAKKKIAKADSIKKQKGSKSKNKINNRLSSSESDEDDYDIKEICQDSDDDIDFLDQNSPLGEENISDFSIEVNSWVLLKYCPKKVFKYCVGQVIENTLNDEYLVKCLKHKHNSAQFFWPEQPDEDTVTKDTIVMILPEPEKDRRGSYMTFNIEFSGNNLC